MLPKALIDEAMRRNPEGVKRYAEQFVRDFTAHRDARLSAMAEKRPEPARRTLAAEDGDTIRSRMKEIAREEGRPPFELSGETTKAIEATHYPLMWLAPLDGHDGLYIEASDDLAGFSLKPGALNYLPCTLRRISGAASAPYTTEAEDGA